MARPISSSPSARSPTQPGGGQGRTSVPSGRLEVQRAQEVVVEPRHPLPAEHLDPAGRAPAQDVVPHAHELGRGARREPQGHRRQVLHPVVPREVGDPARHLGHLAEAEPEDVEVVDGVLDQTPAPGHLDVAAPRGAVHALHREVLVVAKDRRHGRAELTRDEHVAQGTEHRRAAQHQAHLGRHPRVGHRGGERLGPGQVGRERLLAEHGDATTRRPPRRHRGARRSGCTPTRRHSARAPRPHSTPPPPRSPPRSPAARSSSRSCTATTDASTTPARIMACRPMAWAQAITPVPTNPILDHGPANYVAGDGPRRIAGGRRPQPGVDDAAVRRHRPRGRPRGRRPAPSVLHLDDLARPVPQRGHPPGPIPPSRRRAGAGAGLLRGPPRILRVDRRPRRCRPRARRARRRAWRRSRPPAHPAWPSSTASTPASGPGASPWTRSPTTTAGSTTWP